MEIVMAADDNYAKIMMTSINSICKNNKDVNKITFHIIDDGISENNRTILKKFIEKYIYINILPNNSYYAWAYITKNIY